MMKRFQPRINLRGRIGRPLGKRSNPNFDNNKFKMKDKFLELKKQINQVMGSGK